MTNKKKVVVRAKDGSNFRLVHMGYISQEIYDEFLDRMVHEKEISIAEYIEKWTEKDFGVKIAATNVKGITKIKQLIQKRALNSMQFSESILDQCKITGALNAWVTDHMRKELQNESTFSR